HPLHVPQVEVLVAAEPQELAVTVLCAALAAHREIAAAAHEAGRPAVLEAAITFGEHENQEQVTIEISRRAKQADVRLAKRRQVTADAGHVHALMAAHSNGVRNPARLELADEQVADFYRVVD